MSALPARARRAGDVDLMAALAAGDLTALGELYDRHAEHVRRFVFRATGEAAAADDVTQDAFLTLTRAAARYDGSHPARSFVLGIAAKLVLRRRRSLAQRLRNLSLFGVGSDRAFERTPEDDVGSQEQLVRFRRALERLPEPKRLVVLLADVEGLTGEQIASALEIPIGTVWTRLHYGRRQLRQVLGRPTPRKGAPG
jgi:RNA polymerase sigma-70 factor (ECF subfamily)